MEQQEIKGLDKGQVLHAPWGYNMTHPDFYLVLEGAPVGKFAKVQQIARVETATGYLSGTAVPAVPYVPRANNAAILRKKVQKDGSIKFESYKRGTLWNGQPKYFNYCD